MKKVYTKNAPEAIGPYSQGVISNGLLFTSGQIAIDPQTNKVEDNCIEGQVMQVMENLQAICKEAGTSLDKTVKTTCFLANMEDFNVFNKIYETYFKNKPARSCVAVKELPKGVLVEVELIAEI